MEFMQHNLSIKTEKSKICRSRQSPLFPENKDIFAIHFLDLDELFMIDI